MILKEMSLKEKQIYIHSAVNTGISMEPVLDEIMREQDVELLEYAVGCMEEQGGESFASGRGRYELDKQQGKAPRSLQTLWKHCLNTPMTRSVCWSLRCSMG